jgi:hypothetical protein
MEPSPLAPEFEFTIMIEVVDRTDACVGLSSEACYSLKAGLGLDTPVF